MPPLFRMLAVVFIFCVATYSIGRFIDKAAKTQDELQLACSTQGGTLVATRHGNPVCVRSDAFLPLPKN